MLKYYRLQGVAALVVAHAHSAAIRVGAFHQLLYAPRPRASFFSRPHIHRTADHSLLVHRRHRLQPLNLSNEDGEDEIRRLEDSELEFDKFDIDSNGDVSLSELKEVLRKELKVCAYHNITMRP